MVSVIRIETIHPIFVHLTIGAMPLLVLLYGVAWWRKSERWAVAGDVTLVFATVVTLFTFAFGLVSNGAVHWPGGLSLWRWLHLGCGALTTLLLVVLAVARLTMRRIEPLSRSAAFGFSCIVAVVAGFTGWIGGEVLVYQSGIAVAAAGDGAFAPPTAGARTPSSIQGAMTELRPSWGAVTTNLGAMIVGHPTLERREAVARNAQRLEKAAIWLATKGPALVKGGFPAPESPSPSTPTAQAGSSAAASTPGAGDAGGDSEASGAVGAGGDSEASGAVGPAGDSEASAGGAEQPAPDVTPSPGGAGEAPGGEQQQPEAALPPRARELEKLAKSLEQDAGALNRAARQRDLHPVAESLGRVEADCVACHEKLRWTVVF